MKQKTERGQAKGWPSAILIYTDGASRGNPGPASAGFVVYRQLNPKVETKKTLVKQEERAETTQTLVKQEEKVDYVTTFLYERAFLLGTQTSNFAEYSAVLEALKMSAKNQVQHLIIKSDSELLVRQLSGLYKVRSSSLKKLYQECKKWERGISKVRFQHIPREQNKTADALASHILNQTNVEKNEA